MEEKISIFKRASTGSVDRNTVLNALQECRVQFTTLPLEKLEEDLMFQMMPCMRALFFEIYAENQKIDTVEQIEDLLGNLTITLSLTDFMEDVLNFVLTQLEPANLKLFKSIMLEIPKCIYITYKHCKESQKKYQQLMKDCKEILLLYKKNQECHTKFLNIMSVLPVDVEDESCIKILIETIQSVSSIIEILLGLNIKALADSWKSYWNIIEKHTEILVTQRYYCVKEIELLELQLRNFMDSALESNDDKQLFQYSKLSGFLLKIALKIVVKFWQYLHLDHLESIYNLVCTVYNYSPEFLHKRNLETGVKKSIQICLLDVVTTFVEEKLLCEDVLEQILSNFNTTRKDYIGCLGLNLKILEFVTSQDPDSVDPTFFSAVLNIIFSNFTAFFPEPYSDDSVQIPTELIGKLSSEISESIKAHNSFYDEDFESVMISNILGNHVGCHILASVTWIQILSQASPNSRNRLVSELLELINQSQIELPFNSSKVIFLKRFMHKLFSILGEDEKAYFLKLYPPIEYMQLWRIIGLDHISGNENSILNSSLEFLSTNLRDMKNLASTEEAFISVETLKLFAGASNSILEINSKRLTDIVQTLWESNFESVNCDNAFLKYFISSLSEVTIKLMNHFSNDQIFSILRRMEVLVNIPFVKLKLCFILSEISTRKTEHNMEQNKLNFLISDLLELLLKENNKMVHDLGLRVFQQFARSNQYIIVNNVSRMLPDMNLEKYIKNNTGNISLHDHFKLLNLKSLEHECLPETRKSISTGNSFESKNRNFMSRENSFDTFNGKSFSREGFFETRNESPVFVNKSSVELKRTTNFNSGTSQCKRIKLGDGTQEDDDTVGDVLDRIKSEIKCLNKTLCREKLTPKNAQRIKMLACQLQNLLDT